MSESRDRPTARSWRSVILPIVAVALLVGMWLVLPVAEWIEAFRSWVAGQGIWGHVVFAVVYALATVALAPGAPLTLAAGLAFGLAAFPTVLIGAAAGAGLAFLSGRYLARGWVERKTAKSRTFKAIDRAIESEGWKIVALMRLSPLMPFNLQNYLFGVTKVGFWPYFIASFFGIMPGTLLYVWIGSLGAVAGGDAAAMGSAGTLKTVTFVAGLLATLVVTVIVSRKAAQKLREIGIDEEEAVPGAGP